MGRSATCPRVRIDPQIRATGGPMMIIDFECDTPTRESVEDTVRLIRSGRGFDKEGYAQSTYNILPGGVDVIVRSALLATNAVLTLRR